MRRAGNLIERMADPENIRLAYLRAIRGKCHKASVQAFGRRLDEEVRRIREGLLSGSMTWGPYHQFRVYDPKERLICAAPFRDRVAQHAIMALCEASFESYQIYDSYACRRGKGLDGALARAQRHARYSRWYAKLDVRKYFDSIDQEILKGLLRRRFKDARLLTAFDALIESWSSAPGKGIPIGNLSSQYFANHYLGVWDHFCVESLLTSRYVRYMDDFVAWGNDKERLKDWAEAARSFLQEQLGLEVKPLCLNACIRGMTFLGYRVFPGVTLLSRRSRVRFRRKLRTYHDLYERDLWDEEETARHVEPLCAFVRRAPEDGFPQRAIEALGLCPRARTV